MLKSYARKLLPAAALAATLIAHLGHAGSTEVGKYEVAPGLLAAVMALHGLDEEGAIERLVKEVEATEVYQAVRELEITSYAGSWLDPDRLILQVAIRNPEDARLVKRIGADPVLESRDLAGSGQDPGQKLSFFRDDDSGHTFPR